MLRLLYKIVSRFIYWVFTLVAAMLIGVGVAGGIMYLNEKLNSYGTIWLGG